ncbi:purine-cytosine permease family protein [Gluconobacter cerinus]|uniref:purine-cytosine permease family protein n=1 Tax=Gluconobacter cerinus TaxID=38307 RepID=UPI001B8D49B6|nr:cytosine permease [Gluconobacter cerinus]MBS1019238.1 cytosine permease [Gluconobacter cerinus]MBS1067805.1 cytosine permease [Gluconobacter cerinus]
MSEKPTMTVSHSALETGVESQTIYPVPASERHGRSKDLFGLWFGANMTMLTISTGMVMRTTFHLTPLTAVVAAIFGNLIGGLFMALHAAQGPHLGIPQMVQSRAQFGMLGAAPMTALIVIMFLGFSASNLVLGAQGLSTVMPMLGSIPGMVIVALLSFIPSVLGYRAIHQATRMSALFCGGAVFLCLIVVIMAVPHSAAWWIGEGQDTIPRFLGALSIAALWQIAYAPYVSDYSRYLPDSRSGEKQAFHATYWGCVLGSFFAMLVGIIAGANTAAVLEKALGLWGAPVLGVLSLGIVVANAMNLYCGALSSITVFQTIAPKKHFGQWWRIGVTLALLLVSLVLAVDMASKFDSAYAGFLELLMAIMVPWSAINLVDYYILRHGNYDIASFFANDGGIYGRFNFPALLSFIFGLLVQIPFLSDQLYVGPMAKLFGGADLSWVFGLSLTGAVYTLTMRRTAKLR